MAQKIETDEVAAFVAAADRLVNDLATARPSLPSAARRLDRRITASYDRYEKAKAALVGDQMDGEEAMSIDDI